LVYGLYLGKLGLAIIFTFPIFVMTNGALSQSSYARPLLREWSLDVFIELTHAVPNVFTTMVVVLMFYLVLAFVVKQFINGGIYRSLSQRRRLTGRDFFAASGELFVANLKISLLMAAIYLVLGLTALMLGSLVPEQPFRRFGFVSLVPGLLRIALLYVFFILGTILSDLSRLRMAVGSTQSLRDVFRSGWEIYRTHFVQLIGVYYLYFIPFALVWVVIELLALQVTGSMSGLIGVVIELVLFQICSFLRTGQSLLATATFACVGTDEQGSNSIADLQRRPE
jgi:hypothetical protein